MTTSFLDLKYAFCGPLFSYAKPGKKYDTPTAPTLAADQRGMSARERSRSHPVVFHQILFAASFYSWRTTGPATVVIRPARGTAIGRPFYSSRWRPKLFHSDAISLPLQRRVVKRQHASGVGKAIASRLRSNFLSRIARMRQSPSYEGLCPSSTFVSERSGFGSAAFRYAPRQLMGAYFAAKQ